MLSLFMMQTWSESLQDLDMLFIMIALASGPPAAVFIDMLQTMGAGPLLQAAGKAFPILSLDT